SAVGVIIHKRVGNRYLEKRVNIRIEHVNHSKCRDDFLRRVKENAAAAKAARAEGKTVQLKRQPAQPRDARIVSTKNNVPTTITAIPYDTLI
ncbi:60S ribosomal protein L21A, partial [Coemansia sp. RSA 486]